MKPSPATRGEGYNQDALDAASREVHMMLLREGSSWGTKACEEMGRVFMTAYRKALPSETPRSAVVESLIGQLRKPLSHDECEDSWYSCSQHPNCADDRRAGQPCDCGSQRLNELHAHAADALERTVSATPQKPDPLSPAAITAEAARPDPMQELATYIKESIRLCDHGYIHITCGRCTAPGLQP